MGRKFSEPVALSSTPPVGFPLARTAPWRRFDLLAPRARCKGKARPRWRRPQGPSGRAARNLRKVLPAQPELADPAACSKGAGPEFTEPVALSSTEPADLPLART